MTNDIYRAQTIEADMNFSGARRVSSSGRTRAGRSLLAALALWLSCASFIYPQQTPKPASQPVRKEANMTTHATGTFEVSMTPLPAQDAAGAEATLGAMSLDKQFHGALEATSKGRMLTAGTAVKDSAGYVAVERVSGALDGRTGSFALIHRGIMSRGKPELLITVVPDSGTGQLVGLSGTLTIQVADGKHTYNFEYTLAPAP